jgi:hypothetical protein
LLPPGLRTMAIMNSSLPMPVPVPPMLRRKVLGVNGFRAPTDRATQHGFAYSGGCSIRSVGRRARQVAGPLGGELAEEPADENQTRLRQCSVHLARVGGTKVVAVARR